jgi:nucleoside-triphosphatase
MHLNPLSKILLTGLPGCGKTTAVMRILERLKGVKAAGFYTEEIRQDGRREGFRWKRLDGKEGILSHVDLKGRLRVGRYGVDVAGFEREVVPVLELGQVDVELFVVDEIGKMECMSGKFAEAMKRLLAGNKPVVATIALKGGGFISEAKKMTGIELITMTERNREAVIEQIRKKLLQ